MTPTPARNGAFQAACAAIAALNSVESPTPLTLDVDRYVRGTELAYRSMRRFQRRANHFANSWRGDGVQATQTRQMRRAEARKAVKRS